MEDERGLKARMVNAKSKQRQPNKKILLYTIRIGRDWPKLIQVEAQNAAEVDGGIK